MRILHIIRQLTGVCPEAKVKLGLAVLLAICASVLYPIPLLAAWIVLCGFLSAASENALPVSPAMMAVFSLVLCIASRIGSSWFAHVAAAKISRSLRLMVMGHLGKLPLHWFSSRSTGELKKILNNDIGELDHFLSHNVTDCVSAFCLPFMSIAVMAWADWRLALVLAILMIVAVLIQVGSFKDVKNSNFMEQYNAALTMLHVDSVDFVQGMPVIKIFNRSAESFDRMNKAIAQLDTMQDKVVSVYALRWAKYLAVIFAPLAVLVIVGGLFFLHGSLALENFILAILFGSLALVPLVSLLRFSSFIMRTVYSWSAVEELLATPVEERGSRTRADMKSPTLEVHDLSVSYDGKQILHDISFKAASGTVTAVVGMSGSGKSTLAAVLAGMEKADGGSIFLGGVPLEDLSAPELAACFSIVFQKPFIFTGTIWENICLGNETATPEQVKEAARMTHAADFIGTLPKGYDTIIGAGGDVHLSGGQYQIIALTRMALRDTPVVLLDEATAFADPESEAAIQKGLATFLSGKTVIVIAHRLRSIANADNIIVLDQGRIVQSGKHEELLGQDGMYSHLWKADETARAWSIQTGAASFEGAGQ